MTHGLPPCLSDGRRGLAIPPSGYESGPQLVLLRHDVQEERVSMSANSLTRRFGVSMRIPCFTLRSPRR